MKLLSSFTQAFVVTDPYDFISFSEHKGGLWLLFSIPLVPMGTEAFASKRMQMHHRP